LDLGIIREERIKATRDKITTALKNHFKPEFLNRIDEVVIFNYLSEKEMSKIADLEIAKVAKRLNKKTLISK